MQKINTTPSNNMLSDDYTWGLLTILWFVQSGKRILVFASAELFPHEYPRQHTQPELSQVARNPKGRLYIRRVVCDASKLMEWYWSIDKNPSLFWQENNEPFEPLRGMWEPPLNELIVANNVPFARFLSESVRTSTFYSPRFSAELISLLKQPPISAWIKKELFFDLIQFSEYIGTATLIAYNPLIRKTSVRLDQGEKEILMTIEPRQNVDLSTLRLLHVQKRPKGYSSFIENPIDSNIIVIEYSGNVDAVAYAIYCTRRGLLSYHNFAPFIKTIALNLNIQTGERCVRSSKGNYNVPIKQTETIIQKDDTLNQIAEDIRKHILNCENDREKRLNSSCDKQYICYNNENDVLTLLRDNMKKAHARIIIVDPYLSANELFDFVYAVSSRTVETILVSSASVLSEKVNKSSKSQGQVLFDNIVHYESEIQIKPYVMTGKNPIFHDRFIVVDDEVWLSGNSFHHISKRFSVILKLHDPEPVISFILASLQSQSKVMSLSSWLNRTTRSKNEKT
jgi:hypothetical protein